MNIKKKPKLLSLLKIAKLAGAVEYTDGIFATSFLDMNN